MRHKYILGKCDYNKSGRRNCKADFEWKLSDEGEFTMRAHIWNPRETDIYCGGQCIEEVLAYFPNDKLAQRMAAVWREWHLNNMTAGSPAQEAWVKAHKADYHPASPGDSHYDWACRSLNAAGLNPDPGYVHNGQPYRYGHAWLKRELPAEVRAEIESWPHNPA